MSHHDIHQKVRPRFIILARTAKLVASTHFGVTIAASFSSGKKDIINIISKKKLNRASKLRIGA